MPPGGGGLSVVDWDRSPLHKPNVWRSIPGQDQFDLHTSIYSQGGTSYMHALFIVFLFILLNNALLINYLTILHISLLLL